MKKGVDIGSDSIPKLLLKLAIPAIIAQLVNLLYNMVDRIFIGKLENGHLAMAGVGLVLPIIMIISAFSMLIGMGGAPVAAIKMGEKDNEGAEHILSNSFSCLILIGIILTITFYIFKTPILTIFGASESTLVYAEQYFSIYVIGTIFVQIALGMNSFINTQGFANIGMFTVIIGACINIILDPILIFTLNMGVKGAALATIIGQFVSSIWVLRFLFGGKSILKIRKKFLIPNKKIVLSIITLGISPFIMQSTESLVLISQNNQFLKYGGDLAVGAMTIMNSIMQMIILPLMGVCQGAQPIIGYNYGAGNMDRVKKTFKLTLITCLSYTSIMTSLILIFPKAFVYIFNSESALVEITSYSMRIFFIGMTIFGVQIACQQTFLALGQAKISLILALLRKVVLLVPFIFIFPMFAENKLKAAIMAEPAADIIATLITVICFVKVSKKLFKDK